MARMVQVELASGTARRTCWVGLDKRPTVGSRITLRNSEDAARLWDVLAMSEAKDSDAIHDDWNVGGVTSRR